MQGEKGREYVNTKENFDVHFDIESCVSDGRKTKLYKDEILL
jgi:hypothetical protein